MPGNNPGCSRPLHPIQVTECGPCLTVGPMPTGQGRIFFPHKCNHWVVHLKKHFLKENSLLNVHPRTTITPYCVLKKNKMPLQPNKLQILLSFLALKPYQAPLSSLDKFLKITKLKHIIFINWKCF